MKEELLNQSMELLLSAAQKGSVLSQETARQYLDYASYSTILGIVIFGGFFLISAIVFIWSLGDIEDRFGTTIVSGIFAGFMLLGTACNIDDLIKLKVAPNVFVIEKVSKLMKGDK